MTGCLLNDELKGMWNEVVVAWLQFPCRQLEVPRECGWGSNTWPPAYGAAVSATLPLATCPPLCSLVDRGLQTTINNAAITTLQGKTRGCWCSCKLLMMGVEAPETCWATHKRQVINLWNCCIWLVDLFELYDDARTCQRQSWQITYI